MIAGASVTLLRNWVQGSILLDTLDCSFRYMFGFVSRNSQLSTLDSCIATDSDGQLVLWAVCGHGTCGTTSLVALLLFLIIAGGLFICTTNSSRACNTAYSQAWVSAAATEIYAHILKWTHRRDNTREGDGDSESEREGASVPRNNLPPNAAIKS